MNNGATCCKFYERKNDTELNTVCDGGWTQLEDPEECCSGATPCLDPPCANHDGADGKITQTLLKTWTWENSVGCFVKQLKILGKSIK